jgi:hypothetical protein
MLFTRPRRQRVYGVVYLLLWLTGLMLIWAWFFHNDFDVEGISSLYIPDTYFTLGIITWIGLTERHIIVPFGTMPTSEWSVEIIWQGVVGNLLVTALVGWLCWRSWRRSVDRRCVAESNCDDCGYDLSRSPSRRCPECGLVNSSTGVDPGPGLSAALCLAMIAAFFFFQVSVAHAAILGLRFGYGIAWISAVGYAFMAVASIAVAWGVVVEPWLASGRSQFGSRSQTPHKRLLRCVLAGWFPAMLAGVYLLCGVILVLVRPRMYGDGGPIAVLLMVVLGTLAYGGVAHVLMARRVRQSARRAGVCFRCGTKFDSPGTELCCDCGRT